MRTTSSCHGAPNARRRITTVWAALALVLPGACSSGGDARSDRDLSVAQAAEFETEVEFARCMRDQGIEGFPDPQVSESGWMSVGVPWEADETDQWEAAVGACDAGTDEPAPDEAAVAGWERIVPGGDCACADGSEFAFWERRADPSKVVFFLDGGGTCRDATTCQFLPEDPAYDFNVEGDDPSQDGGIFDLDRADNPFRDYSFVLVPECTGDAHLGDVTREYTPELTVQHKGFVNGTAVLDYVAENYPGAAQVVVVGKTTGSVAAPLYGGLVADRLPAAQVTVFGAQSGHVPDNPDLNTEVLGELWGAFDKMPDWEVNEGLTARDWGPPRFWIQTGLHDPEIVLARFDYAYDEEAAKSADDLGIDPSDLLAVIDANEAAIEEAGVVQHSYTAPGDGHGVLEWPEFYETEVGGVALVDWVAALIAGEPLDDVHCDDCEPP
jgi:hypothetical protein